MIHIPITRVSEQSSRLGGRFFVSLFGTFAIGAMLGIFVSTTHVMRAPTIGEGFRNQLGAIGVLGGNTDQGDPIVDSEDTTPSVSSQTISPPDVISASAIAESTLTLAEPVSPVAPVVTVTRTLREQDVLAQQIVVDRLTLEMTQIKNASLALITQFDQNCGNWGDACALPYSDKLEINNRTYERLTKARNSEMLVLLRFQTLLDETP